MGFKKSNKAIAEFNMSSLTDIVFLLLIFFMLTSTLVNPNALKLLLPKGGTQTSVKQSVNIGIDANLNYYVDGKQVPFEQVEGLMKQAIASAGKDAGLVLSADKSVPIENVVKVMDIANRNRLTMVIATEPDKN
jgi:biopolymer transport protein ExbD